MPHRKRDAATRPNFPRLWVEVSLFDSAGTTPIAQLTRGQTVTVRGHVLAAPDSAARSITGLASLLWVALYPFTLLGTWVHEMGHGLGALLCGGRFDRLEIFEDASGLAFTARLVVARK